MQGKAYLYSINYIIWPELKDFVNSLLDFQVLRLVPREALLIRSYENGAFSSPHCPSCPFASSVFQ